MTKKTTHEEMEQRIIELEKEALESMRIIERFRENELRFKASQHVGLIGSWDRILKTSEVYWSDQIYRIRGYEPQGVTPSYELVMSQIHPDDLQKYLKVRDAAYYQNEPYHQEYRLIRKDGEIRIVSAIGKVEWDETGEPIRYFGTTQDITEHKRAEEALRESEEKYRSLFESAPIGIGVSDMDGNIITFNDAMIKPGGYNREDIVNRVNMKELYYNPDDRNTVLSTLKENGFVDGVEVQFKRKDGTPHDTLMSLRPIKLGEKTYFHAMVQDITEQKQAEEALRKSEEKFRDLVEGSIQGVLIHRDSKPLLVNQAYAAMYGYTPEEILHMESIVPLSSPQDQKRLDKYKDNRLIGKEAPAAYEFQGVHRDGSLIWLENRVRVIQWEGQPAIQATSFDISNRKQAEEILRQHNAYLSALNETTLGLMRRLDLEELLEAILSRVAVLLGTKDGYVYLCDDEKRLIEMRVGLGVQKEFERLRLKPGEGVAGTVWETGEPLIVNDYRRWNNRLNEARYGTIQASIGIPLKSGSEILGVIGLSYFEENRKFTELESSLLSQFAELASIALDNARLYTKLKQANDELEQRVDNRTIELEISNEQLEIQKKNLEEVNTALRVLLKRRDEDRLKMEQKVMFNMNELILPYVEKLNSSDIDDNQKLLLDILESNLNDITSPFSQSLSQQYKGFTPSEMQIANLIKQGKTSKQIAELLNLSSRTIETHRKNVRKKLGLDKKKINLRSHLLSIQ